MVLMTFGGNIKQRVSLWAAIALYAVSAIFGFQFLVSGHSGDRGIAIVSLVSAVLASIGVWTLGVERRPADSDDSDDSDDSEEDEWQDAIK
jgi:hypothetical protein